ncbi:uncharacterized protein L3040_002412 [Drepanopeziza brunnea f. sp. 'multigermtubi']|uniref:uncharacterized protein n=1 Tax=Drepanopeziza brunnea f. sp. 'multigermtubi' TaxID=698441 RepID=UPI0023A1C67B|nr:hypothetical protein L3040_002412 [Drepanopeziza brunnea f. sp. 'multigermtubi']
MSPPSDMTIRFCETQNTCLSEWTTKKRSEKTANNKAKPTVHPVEVNHGPTPRLDDFGRPLVPSHTDDPLDPLNWTKLQKRTVLAVACSAYFASTYLITIASDPSLFLSNHFQASESQLHWISRIPSLGLAISPLLAPVPASRYGRRVVMVSGTAIALLASGCTSLVSANGISLSGYLAARFFQGFGMGPAANVGLAIVNDLTWEHERGFRVGVWALAGNQGLLVGQLVGSLLNTVEHKWLPYHLTMIFGVLLILEIALLPETLYPRANVASSEQNSAPGGTSSSEPVEAVKRTRQLPFLNFASVPGIDHPNPRSAITQVFKTWTSPALAMSVGAFVFFQYWWVFAVLRAQTVAYGDFQPRIRGLLVLGLVFGALLAEWVFSGRASDAVVRRLTRIYEGSRHHGMRLWLGYPAAVFSSIGLVVWGFSAAESWHWMAGQCGIFLYAAGLQIGTATLAAYLVDGCKDHAVSAIAFYAFFVNVSAFVSPWFVYAWIEKSGFTWTFSSQAIICISGIPPMYFVLQTLGWPLS